MVNSAGFLIKDSAVYMAYNHLGPGAPTLTSDEQRHRLASFDIVAGTVRFSRLYDQLGVFAALVQGDASYDQIYVGGNSAQTSNSWHLSIYRLQKDAVSGDELSFSETLLKYNSATPGSCDEVGFNDITIAPYISHLGFMNDATSGG